MAGSRSAVRDSPDISAIGNYPSQDPFTATIRNTITAFYFNGQTMSIRGPFQALAPLTGAGLSWTGSGIHGRHPAEPTGLRDQGVRRPRRLQLRHRLWFLPGLAVLRLAELQLYQPPAAELERHGTGDRDDACDQAESLAIGARL
jgi:hypothetical protein